MSGLSEQERDGRMAAISDQAIRIAEDVWTEDEPTLAEYELTERIVAAAREEAATILANHQRASTGMTYGSPDVCMCGERIYVEPGEEEVTIRRARAFAMHQAGVLAADIRKGCTCESSPPEFGGNLPDRDCPIHSQEGL